MRNFFSLALSMRAPLRKYTGGFTLVELIVVITILAILSAIWLLSFSGYSSGARDSTRVEDLTNMQKSLAISATTSVNGKYPTPDNGVQILNGGNLMNTQGYAWKTTLSSIKFNGAGLDPLDNQYYTYSVNKTQTGFALMAYLENASNLTLTSYIEKSLAATTDYSTRFPMVSGNPIGVLIASGSLQPIQATATAPIELTTSTTPYTAYIAPKNTVTWSGATFASAVATSVAVATTGTGGGSTGVSGACTGLPANAVYYGSGTSYSITNGASLTASYTGGALVANSCNFNCNSGYAWNGSSCITASPYSSSTTYTPGQAFTYNGATVMVTATGVGSSSTKAVSTCDTNDIVVWSGTNIQIWAACNVGATTLYTGQTMASGTPTAGQEAYLGGMYQWGRNDDVAAGTFVWSQYNGALTNGSTSNTNFYVGDGSYYDWYTPDINLSTPGLWNPNGTTSSIAGNNQGPCPAGYGVPSGGTSDATTEWGKLYTIFGGTYDTIRSTLKLPLSGLRNWNNGTYGSQGTVGYYWSSSPYGTYSYGAYFVVGGGNIASSTNRADGFSVRCVRH